MSVYLSLLKELCCPLCGDTAVQIDEVRIAGGYSKDSEVTVNADGQLRVTPGATPVGPLADNFSEHRFALTGWCGNCHGAFAFVFTRQAGKTIVESVKLAGIPRQSRSSEQSMQLESEAERRFWEAHVAASEPALHGLVTQHPVAGYRIDFALPDQEFAIEIDGYAYHSSKDSFENDRRRHRALERLGWRIVRYSGKEACNDPAACVRDAAEAAARFRPEIGAPS